jgi:hypothetical protein
MNEDAAFSVGTQKCSGDILEKAGNGSTIGSQQRSEPLE